MTEFVQTPIFEFITVILIMIGMLVLEYFLKEKK